MTTLFNWSSHGGQNEDKTLLQRSQPCHKGEFRHESISASDHNDVDRIFVGRAHKSTTKVCFCTIIGHCMIVIMSV